MKGKKNTPKCSPEVRERAVRRVRVCYAIWTFIRGKACERPSAGRGCGGGGSGRRLGIRVDSRVPTEVWRWWSGQSRYERG